MKNRKVLLTICAVLSLTITGWSFAHGRQSTELESARQQEQTVQSITVKLTQEGYQPSSLKLQRDAPARLTFVRETDASCGKELVIQEYNIRRALPLNEPVVVEFTPHKSGEFTFTCGMGMLRGKIIVA